jgi:hypothetical protein
MITKKVEETSNKRPCTFLVLTKCTSQKQTDQKHHSTTTMSVTFSFGPSRPPTPPSVEEKEVDKLREELFVTPADELEHLQQHKELQDADYIVTGRFFGDGFSLTYPKAFRFEKDAKIYPLSKKRKAAVMKVLTLQMEKIVDHIDKCHRKDIEKAKEEKKKNKRQKKEEKAQDE